MSAPDIDDPKSLRTRFRNDGYVALPGFLNETEIVEVKRNLDRYSDEIVPDLSDEHVFYEKKDDKSTLKQLQQMFSYDDFFKDMMFGSKFERVAEILLEDEVEGKNLQYFNKAPQVGQATPPHQDGYYFMLKPPEAVTMWLAIEEVDEENGCVRYVPGSHKKGMRPHGRTDTLGFSQGITDYGTEEDKKLEKPIPASPGDLLVHHALTIHRADGNNSKERSRKAMGFIYYAASAEEDKEAHEEYQKKLAEEMKEEGKI